MPEAVSLTVVESCEHRWRYYVDVRARAVRSRRCDRCGLEMALAGALAAPAPQERRSA